MQMRFWFSGVFTRSGESERCHSVMRWRPLVAAARAPHSVFKPHKSQSALRDAMRSFDNP